MLSGFFDAAATPQHPGLTSVAGVLFDDSGLSRFHDGWNEIKSSFMNDYPIKLDVGNSLHANACCGQRGYEQYEGWMPELRHRLCRKVAELTGNTMMRAFVSFCLDEHYLQFVQENKSSADRCGGIYPMTVMSMLEGVGRFAGDRNEKIAYFFEEGDKNQNVMLSELNHVSRYSDLIRRYAYLSHACIPKSHPDAKPLMCADLLAWEWNRNLGDQLRAEVSGCDPGNWSESFKFLAGSKGINIEQLNVVDMCVRGIVSAAHLGR